MMKMTPRPVASEMPFLDHLEELRWRIIWSLLAVVISTVIGWFLVTRFDGLGLLMRPIEPYLQDGKLTSLNPMGPFFVTLRLALVAGFILASPVVIYQVWSFLAPALHPAEKRLIVPSLYFGLVLFVAGMAMAYYIVLPATLKFTLSFQTESLVVLPEVDKYLSLVVRLLLAFGLVFELPVVITILSALGMVTPAFLASKRRYAIAGIAVLSSLITPGDVITLTIMMMVPLVFLYEISIVLSRLVTRRRLEPAGVEA